MNVWGWIYQLIWELQDNDLEFIAELVEDYPGLCLHSSTEAVEAAHQQLLQFAEQLEIPWLEVFARHWYLQHQLCIRNNVEIGLPGAVRLLEIAHRDENKDCPQSICAVQDLGIAYGKVDGPGYCRERRQVSEETLERINPSWPCFACISSEYAQALLDEDRAEEAIAFLDEQARKIREHDEISGELQNIRAEACLKLGLNERVLRLTQDQHENSADSVEAERLMFRAVALARMGKAEQARKLFPSWSTVRRLPAVGPNWAESWGEFVRLGVYEPDGDRVRAAIDFLHEIAEELESGGGIRPAFQVETVTVELAIKAGDKPSAERGIELLSDLLPRLRAPCGADEKLRELKAATG